MKGEDVKTLSGLLPVAWGEFLGSIKNDMEEVWAGELVVKGVVS